MVRLLLVADDQVLILLTTFDRKESQEAMVAPPAPALDALTPRELHILRLVGTGQTNGEIAAALNLGEATVKTHLNRTMAKLNLASRAQAVVVAYEAGLVIPRHLTRAQGCRERPAHRLAR